MNRTSAGKPLLNPNIVAPIVVLLGIILIWELFVFLFNPPTFLLPAPHIIVQALISNGMNLLAYGLNTFLEAFTGFVIGCSLGLLVAMAVARSKTLADLFVPLAVASNSVPILAMAPIAIVWFGVGPASKIAIVAVMCFFPTMVSAVRGLTAASPDAVALMHSYAATNWQIFAKLRFPTALPFIFNALKICTALSMIGAIVAGVLWWRHQLPRRLYQDGSQHSPHPKRLGRHRCRQPLRTRVLLRHRAVGAAPDAVAPQRIDYNGLL
ncbi:MAG: ABC transporter permease [Anaerolineales bacterium]|nr:ABC transporter permease [Anaerolineales bacterium]